MELHNGQQMDKRVARSRVVARAWLACEYAHVLHFTSILGGVQSAYIIAVTISTVSGDWVK